MLKIGHSVTRPGRNEGDEPITINVAEELETVPGVVQNSVDVDFYSREYPLESQNIDLTADREWVWTVYTKEVLEDRKIHDRLNGPIVAAAKDTGQMEPTAEPEFGKDVTEEIKAKAKELGFGEVGITRLDMRYIFKYKKSWAEFPHAICLAYEQEYEPTQSAPSIEAEGPHFGTYRIMGAVALDLADHIRSLGYHAQVHSPNDNSGAYIPMFVEAGLGQLGANGQLLSPHFGSRARLMVISTDAVVTHDEPIDYGIHAFCSICQVCVNRCPGRALMRDKVWWRGVQKHKLIYKRCRPVMARYEGCAVCMKVCPIQRYGMEPVMTHYVNTGQVLGKGTDLLEGYTLRDKGYFGPGELPHFDTEFFQIPHGKSEDMVFEELKEKIAAGDIPDDGHGNTLLQEFKTKVANYVGLSVDDMMGPPEVEEA
jgi:Pyruvate/2-oxoacid:ferredoxin oxidoreductase delta subunit